jgi:3-hydroxyisobutyrate dehydrogenase-like beta-hydroxyacid dehydrogenase
LSGTFTAGGTLDIVAKDLQLACNPAREVVAPAHLSLLAHNALSRAQAQAGDNRAFRLPPGSSRRWPGASFAPLRWKTR